MIFLDPRIKFWRALIAIAVVPMISGCDFDLGGSTNLLFKRRQTRTSKTKKKDSTGNGSANDSGSGGDSGGGGFSGSAEIKVTGATINTPNVFYLQSLSMESDDINLFMTSDYPTTRSSLTEVQSCGGKTTASTYCKDGQVMLSISFCKKAQKSPPSCAAWEQKSYSLSNTPDQLPNKMLSLQICKAGKYNIYSPPFMPGETKEGTLEITKLPSKEGDKFSAKLSGVKLLPGAGHSACF